MRRIKNREIKKRILLSMVVTLLAATVSCGLKTPSEPADSTLEPVTTPTREANPEKSDPDSTPTPTEPVPETPSNLPTPTETAEPYITPEITPEPTIVPPSPVFHSYASNYFNYTNTFPFVSTDTGSAEFSYDDTLLLINSSDVSQTFSLSEMNLSENKDYSDPEAWFFCGAFEDSKKIYAHYDYFRSKGDTDSLLLCIEPDIFGVSIIVESKNPRQQFSDTFLEVDEWIYYTKTSYSNYGTPTTKIYRCGLDGSSPALFYDTPFAKTIPLMTSDGSQLYCIITDIDKTSQLVQISPATNTITTVVHSVPAADFLYILGDFAITSVSGTNLTYYNILTGNAISLPLTEEKSLSASVPMTDGTYVYFALVNLSGKCSTRLAKVDLVSATVNEVITLDSTYYYSLGIVDHTLYVEDGDSFRTFQIFP